MKKRVFTVLLIVVIALAALWFARQEAVQGEATPQATIDLSLASGQDTATVAPETETTQEETQAVQPAIDESGAYTAKDDVALYLHTYGRLPDNFITKDEARALGWSGSGLDGYAYGKCIGGDQFGNYEGLLPEKSGRLYYECDIDTLHGDDRGAKRVVYSSDGLIYYTGDHYESFTLLYGEP